ncbi:hypothetical protein Stsp02_09870 [Streptomyces sp. NBRC 14336]|uniref:glycosyltransferase n=1 Tax=Streptomyces sp. NBRC 14336 TaxID=3030992 RepID=UPI0024A2E71B|nr:glycosyltransferase [Streptomyces sp. NBRC 14336]WBO78255.1 glycosyltransferase [Streptomyces sp. SBE_14.2]GLW45325.1 hypothetical protein Stsp02_09870 [Streptomyces sp. NBRC 14336]
MTIPTITAVILTKDEEACIGETVRALADAVDKVLLIDAGSTDGTVASAHRAAEAVRLPFEAVLRPWRDDFAAQRNHAFTEVTEGWILFVDADERLRDGHGARLRQALRDVDEARAGRDVVLSPRIVNIDGSGSYDRTRRMLRTDSPLRFRGRIHEQPFHPDGTAPRSVGLDVELIHHGYLPEVITARDKRNRDAALIARCRQEEPANPTWVFYAAREVLAAGGTHPEALATAYSDLRAAIDRYGDSGLTAYERQREDESYALLAELALRSGDRARLDDSLAVLRQADRAAEAAYYGTLVDSGVLLARLSALVDGLDEAALAAGPARPRLAARHAELRALLALACGRYDEVADAFRSAVSCGGGDEVRAAFTSLRVMLDSIVEPAVT